MNWDEIVTVIAFVYYLLPGFALPAIYFVLRNHGEYIDHLESEIICLKYNQKGERK